MSKSSHGSLKYSSSSLHKWWSFFLYLDVKLTATEELSTANAIVPVVSASLARDCGVQMA